MRSYAKHNIIIVAIICFSITACNWDKKSEISVKEKIQTTEQDNTLTEAVDTVPNASDSIKINSLKISTHEK